MFIRKTIYAAVIAAGMLSAASAEARIDLDVNLGPAPVVVQQAPVYAPQPVYAAPPPPAYYTGAQYPAYYDPHHRHRDWRYWEEHRGHDPRYYHH